MEPSLSAGSSQRGASVKWTAKLIWPAGGGSAARAKLMAQAREAKNSATRRVRPRGFFTIAPPPSAPSPCPLPLRGGGALMRGALSLWEGEGWGEGARERSCESGRHIEIAAREMWLAPL